MIHFKCSEFRTDKLMHWVVTSYLIMVHTSTVIFFKAWLLFSLHIHLMITLLSFPHYSDHHLSYNNYLPRYQHCFKNIHFVYYNKEILYAVVILLTKIIFCFLFFFFAYEIISLFYFIWIVWHIKTPMRSLS